MSIMLYISFTVIESTITIISERAFPDPAIASCIYIFEKAFH